LVARARQIIEKLLSCHAGLILHGVVFLQAPGNARRLGKKLADSVTVRTGFLGFLTRLLPKIGPLRVLQLKTPTPATERLLELSFNATLLSQVGTGQLALPNNNFDTGEITGPGKYRLNDETHAKLLDALAKENFSGVSPEVRAELLEFFGHPDAPY